MIKIILIVSLVFPTLTLAYDFGKAQKYKNSYDAKMEYLNKHSWSAQHPRGFAKHNYEDLTDEYNFTPKKGGMKISDIEAWVAEHPEEVEQYQRYLAFKNKDEKRMLMYLKKDANNDPKLWPAIGNLYFTGYAKSPNESDDYYEREGFNYYMIAAKMGIMSAATDVAFFYLNGLHTKKDEAKGLEWLTKAADAKHPKAVGQLAAIYHAPLYASIQPDAEKALHYAKMGTELEDAQAQYVLGEIYLTGEGVKKDKKMAKNFFASAAKNGHNGAKELLKKIK